MKYILKLTVFTFIAVMICNAQPLEGFGEGKRHPGERLESYKKVRMIEALKLDEETGLKLIARYNSHRKSIKELEKERGEIMDKLESRVQNSGSDDDFQKTFTDLLNIDRKITDTRKKYLEELKEIFTNKQIAEYLIFERNFMKDLRNVVNDVQKQRMRRD
jgi:hypothetical protein